MQLKLQKKRTSHWVVWFALLIPVGSFAQNTPENILKTASLEQVVQYALVHQPAVQQAQIDQVITNKVIFGKLADWYPQLNFSFTYNRFIDLQKTVFNGNVIPIGVLNTSSAQLTATQNIFNRDVLLASTTASKVRLQFAQATGKSKIDMVVNVTKAYYDALSTVQQINVSNESIVRLQRSLKDAHSRYDAGISDKTDYKRATIQLGNAQALLKTNTELLKYKQEYLRTLIGYPVEQELSFQYDTLAMENEIYLDTLQQLDYKQNMDYKLLYTQRELQRANERYAVWAFLPSLSAFGNYFLNYQNNSSSELYNKRYPYSYFGATLTLPILQGGKRLAKISEQRWTTKRMDLSLTNLQSSLNTEYTRAIASYKSNLSNYLVQKENVILANEVYEVTQLQYQSGIKTYLDVTVAETDLHTTRINYYNALYQVLASKMDVQRALGQINY